MTSVFYYKTWHANFILYREKVLFMHVYTRHTHAEQSPAVHAHAVHDHAAHTHLMHAYAVHVNMVHSKVYMLINSDMPTIAIVSKPVIAKCD